MGVDHCTAFPDRLGSLDWSHCCAAHDLAYSDMLTAKLPADLDLVLCVADAGGWPVALIMGAGLLMFGLPWWIASRRRR